MTNTNLNALRAALEADTIISEDARNLILAVAVDCRDCYGNEYTARDLLDALEDGEYLTAYFGFADDEEEESRQIEVVEEAYGFVEQFA